MKPLHIALLALASQSVFIWPAPVQAQMPIQKQTVAQSGAARVAPERQGSALRLSGSNPMGSRLARDLLVAYGLQARLTSMQEQPGLVPEETTILMQSSEAARTLRGEVRAHGSQFAFADLLSGSADIGMASRRVTATEAKHLAAARIGDMMRIENENIVSLDGIAFVVHRANAIPALSTSQLRSLMSGAITRWSEVGGADIPVTVYAHERNSAEVDLVNDRILGHGRGLARNAVRFEFSEDLADAVAADPGGIGFVGMAYTRNARAMPIASDCGLPPAAPTLFQVKTEEYPLARRLYFYTADKRAPLVDDFMRFVLSESAQATIEHAGFASLEPVFVPSPLLGSQLEAAPSDRLEAQSRVLQDAVRNARRLSITFRFEARKATLDSRAMADLLRLQRWTQQAGAGRSLALVGYSSTDGDFDANVELSRQRVREVEARLHSLGVTPEVSIGVGPLGPVACDNSPEGANLNRRVEVWVR